MSLNIELQLCAAFPSKLHITNNITAHTIVCFQENVTKWVLHIVLRMTLQVHKISRDYFDRA